MPQEWRARLGASAGNAERSLNGEIVHRLEQSLEEPVEARRHTEGVTVKRLRSRRPIVALAFVVIAATAIAAVAATQHTGKLPFGPRYLKSDPDARNLISRGTNNLAGPDSYEAQEIAALAYPSNTLPASLF